MTEVFHCDRRIKGVSNSLLFKVERIMRKKMRVSSSRVGSTGTVVFILLDTWSIRVGGANTRPLLCSLLLDYVATTVYSVLFGGNVNSRIPEKSADSRPHIFVLFERLG